MLIDLFLGSEELSVKDFDRLYEKIRAQSKDGLKYLDDIIHDIGKGFIHISPEYMQCLLNKAINK